jgi:hypothetical protein
MATAPANVYSSIESAAARVSDPRTLSPPVRTTINLRPASIRSTRAQSAEGAAEAAAGSTTSAAIKGNHPSGMRPNIVSIPRKITDFPARAAVGRATVAGRRASIEWGFAFEGELHA